MQSIYTRPFYQKNNLLAHIFSGVLYSEEAYYITAVKELEEAFGPIIFETLPFPWHTEHYREEIGWPITRKFVFFQNPVAQESLADIKLRTISIEKGLSVEGRRTVNLDPGYLTSAKVVLASTKDYAHRIYLRDGIFAETTLYFMNGTFKDHLFTYRDYTDNRTVSLFNAVRKEFLPGLG
jgi:hypothetical protein